MTPKWLRKQTSGVDEVSLNITAMADIFTIILVFLIKSFFSGSISVSPSNDLQLPMANGTDEYAEALKIEVASGAVLVEDKPVATLSHFQFSSADLANGTSRQLLEAIKKERERQNLIAAENPDVKRDQRAIIFADQKTPYSTVKVVLASAALNGFSDYKLAVVKRD